MRVTLDDLPTIDECIERAARVYADWLVAQDPLALELKRSTVREPE